MISLKDVTAARRAEIIADEARMSRRPADYPKAAWREANPIAGLRLDVRDTKFSTRPRRQIVGAPGQARLSVVVLDAEPRNASRIIETIDLTAADAQERLSRYEAA